MTDDDEIQNRILETDFFQYYHGQFHTTLTVVNQYLDGKLSHEEMAKQIEAISRYKKEKEVDFLKRFDHLRRNYVVGGVLRAWYRFMSL